MFVKHICSILFRSVWNNSKKILQHTVEREREKKSNYQQKNIKMYIMMLFLRHQLDIVNKKHENIML